MSLFVVTGQLTWPWSVDDSPSSVVVRGLVCCRFGDVGTSLLQGWKCRNCSTASLAGSYVVVSWYLQSFTTLERIVRKRTRGCL